jgi:hypothetical protein
LAISNADSLEEGFPQGCGCILSSFGSAGWIARLIFFKTRLKVVTLRLRHLSALLQCFLLVALSVLSGVVAFSSTGDPEMGDYDDDLRSSSGTANFRQPSINIHPRE